MESIFFQLAGLSPFVGPPTNPNRTKSKCYNGNGNISNRVDINNGVNIGNRVDIGNAMDIDNGMNIGNRVDIGNRVNIDNGIDNEIPWANRLSPTNLNWTKNKICSNH